VESRVKGLVAGVDLFSRGRLSRRKLLISRLP
jgi:hypothetical protein